MTIWTGCFFSSDDNGQAVCRLLSYPFYERGNLFKVLFIKVPQGFTDIVQRWEQPDFFDIRRQNSEWRNPKDYHKPSRNNEKIARGVSMKEENREIEFGRELPFDLRANFLFV